MLLRNDHKEKPTVEKDEAAGMHRSLDPASWNDVALGLTSVPSSVPNTWFVQRVSSCEQRPNDGSLRRSRDVPG